MNVKRSIGFIFVFACMSWMTPLICKAQFFYELDYSIPVTGEANRVLQFPWAGGLNAVQVNRMDLDQDGTEDLVLFERMADNVRTFLTTSDGHTYAPEYETMFPSGIMNWVLLRDFNGDGLKDIFTGDAMGAKVYVNQTQAGQPLSWEPYMFGDNPWITTKSPVTGNRIVLGMSYDDLPSLIDADGDGDLDMFTMKFLGSGIEYHRNYSMERYGNKSKLEFERVVDSWGKVRECNCGVVAYNNEACPTTNAREQHAGGKGLFALDADNDGDLDMLFVEADCDQLYLLENVSGSPNPEDALIGSSQPFPTTISMTNFPSPYVGDQHNNEDLILSPNLFQRELPETNFKESVWHYRNTGSPDNPQYELLEDNFLQGDMIDVGDNAYPAFFDIDDDGDQDMLIGCYINNKYDAATVYLYENTGTPTRPEFTLVTDDYLDLSAYGYINLKPQFADLNGDRKTDFVFTAETNSRTHLYFIANSGDAAANFSGPVSPSLFSLVWRDENIRVADITQDNRPDLIIGKLNGSLDWYRNTGTGSTPTFTLEQTNYLNLNPTILRQCPSVAVGDLNNDGFQDLIYSDQSGVLSIISQHRNATGDYPTRTEIIYNQASDQYEAKNISGRIWPTIVNLYGTEKPAIVAGTILGGVKVLKNRFPGSNGPGDYQDPYINIYPNPVPSTSVLTVGIDYDAQLEIVNSLGQHVMEMPVLAGQQIRLSLSVLSKGVYFFQFRVNGRIYSRKIVVQ